MRAQFFKRNNSIETHANMTAITVMRIIAVQAAFDEENLFGINNLVATVPNVITELIKINIEMITTPNGFLIQLFMDCIFLLCKFCTYFM